MKLFRWSLITFALSLFCVMPFALSGCGFLVDGDGSTFVGNEDYSVTCKADANNVTINIADTTNSSETVDVVAVKPNEYISGDKYSGVSKETNATGEIVGTHTCGQQTEIQLLRYEYEKNASENQTLLYDNLYLKFYIAKDGEYVAGPYYINDIQSQNTYANKLEAKSKKGIIGEVASTVVDLGCSYTELNLTIDSIIYPNEKLVDGQIVEIDHSNLTDENSYKKVVNGKTYYFKKTIVDNYDNQIKYFTDNNIQTTLILYVSKNSDQDNSPYFLSYEAAKDYRNSTIWAIDTSNECGMGYWIAAVEFLAERYSQEDGQYGYVNSWVIGNEVDAAPDWNPVVNYSTDEISLEDYCEEYLRELRLAELATKKYYSENIVLISVTQKWAGRQPYNGYIAPKYMFAWLNSKITYEGNFYWGVAAHPYGYDLNVADFWENDKAKENTNGVGSDLETTKCITWSNLELWDIYLSQDNLKYNGQIRKVYLTEGGVSSNTQSEANKNRQSAGIAYAYYKSISLDCVEAFIYYRMYDSAGDGLNLNFGLFTSSGGQKPSYEVFKYLDTQYSFVVSNQYLKYISWMDRNTGISYGTVYNNISSYKECMALFNTGYDWDAHWDEVKIKKRQVETVEEYEALLSEET